MSEIKNLRFVRFLKIILDILFGASVIACIGLVSWIGLSSVLISQIDILGTASVPVILRSVDVRQIDVILSSAVGDSIKAAFVDNAQGTLRLETNNTVILLMANLAKLVIAVGLAYVFHLLRKVIETIQLRTPFASENAQRIRRLGYTLLLLAFLNPLIENIAATEILNRLKLNSPLLKPGPTFNFETIFIGLLILLLSYIWSYGLELEQDSALTV